VRRNVPLRHDPEYFHIETACIVQDLHHLARDFEERTQPHITVSREHRTVFVDGVRQHRTVLLRRSAT
jgi:hypothetical protein